MIPTLQFMSKLGMRSLVCGLMSTAILMVNGCGHFLVRDSYVAPMWYSIAYTDVDPVIVALESNSAIPTNRLSKVGLRLAECGFSDLPILYAVRSACLVRHNPGFAGVKATAAAMKELSVRDTYYTGWIPLTLIMPFAFAWDIGSLPVQAIQTAKVTQMDIDLALADLESARRMGYSADTISRGWFLTPATHLDRLGYKSSSPQAVECQGRQANINPQPPTVLYTVKKNEDIYAVAIRFGVAPDDIMRLNGLNRIKISSGQVLKVPVGADR